MKTPTGAAASSRVPPLSLFSLKFLPPLNSYRTSAVVRFVCDTQERGVGAERQRRKQVLMTLHVLKLFPENGSRTVGSTKNLNPQEKEHSGTFSVEYFQPAAEHGKSVLIVSQLKAKKNPKTLVM